MYGWERVFAIGHYTFGPPVSITTDKTQRIRGEIDPDRRTGSQDHRKHSLRFSRCCEGQTSNLAGASYSTNALGGYPSYGLLFGGFTHLNPGL